MRKRFDRYAFVRAWRVSVDERPDPRDTLLHLYKSEGLGGMEGARRWRYYIVTYGIERRKFSSIKTRLITALAVTNASPRRDPRLDSRRRRNKGGEGTTLLRWSKQQRDDESPAFTSRWFTIRPCDYSGFLARNKRPSCRGGGSGFNLTAFITRYHA